MKNNILLTLFFLAAFAASGFAQAMENTGNTEASVPDYSYSEKYKFADDMKKALDIVKLELETLGKATDKLKDEKPGDTKRRIDALEVKSTALDKRLDIARNTNTEAGWNDIKSAISKDYGELKVSVDKIRDDIYNRALPGEGKPAEEKM